MTAPMTPEELLAEGIGILSNLANGIKKHGNYSPESTLTFIEQALGCFRGVAQTVPSLTDAMVEAGARVVALRRGHKSCDELVMTTNAGKQPVWKFYTEEPRAILEAVFNAAPPSNQGASK